MCPENTRQSYNESDTATTKIQTHKRYVKFYHSGANLNANIFTSKISTNDKISNYSVVKLTRRTDSEITL